MPFLIAVVLNFSKKKVVNTIELSDITKSDIHINKQNERKYLDHGNKNSALANTTLIAKKHFANFKKFLCDIFPLHFSN